MLTEINKTDAQGRQQGLWVSYWNDGKVYWRGHFLNNIPYGFWERYYKNGDIEFKKLYQILPTRLKQYGYSILYDNVILIHKRFYVN